MRPVRIFACVMSVIGFCCVLYYWQAFDVSVEADTGRRVVNTGLLQKQLLGFLFWMAVTCFASWRLVTAEADEMLERAGGVLATVIGAVLGIGVCVVVVTALLGTATEIMSGADAPPWASWRWPSRGVVIAILVTAMVPVILAGAYFVYRKIQQRKAKRQEAERQYEAAKRKWQEKQAAQQPVAPHPVRPPVPTTARVASVVAGAPPDIKPIVKPTAKATPVAKAK